MTCAYRLWEIDHICRCTNPFITLNSALTAQKKKRKHFMNLFGLALLIRATFTNTKIQYFVYLLCGLLLVWPQVFQLCSFRPRPLFVIYPYDRQFTFDYKFDSPFDIICFSFTVTFYLYKTNIFMSDHKTYLS